MNDEKKRVMIVGDGARHRLISSLAVAQTLGMTSDEDIERVLGLKRLGKPKNQKNRAPHQGKREMERRAKKLALQEQKKSQMQENGENLTSES